MAQSKSPPKACATSANTKFLRALHALCALHALRALHALCALHACISCILAFCASHLPALSDLEKCFYFRLALLCFLGKVAKYDCFIKLRTDHLKEIGRRIKRNTSESEKKVNRLSKLLRLDLAQRDYNI